MFKNKTVLVTGGNRGIGKEIVKKFAANNANVAFMYAGDEKSAANTLNELSGSKGRIKAYKCDVSDFDAVKEKTGQILNDFNGVDILVNNAGITRDKLTLSMKENDFDDVIGINLKGAFNTVRHLYSHLMKKPGSRIINIASISGIDGNAGQVNYSASKAGLIGLTKSLAKELAARGVTCNAVAPGLVETAMTEKIDYELLVKMTERVPAKRMAQPGEVADLVLFLASESSGYITGQVIRIDGGLTI